MASKIASYIEHKELYKRVIKQIHMHMKMLYCTDVYFNVKVILDDIKKGYHLLEIHIPSQWAFDGDSMTDVKIVENKFIVEAEYEVLEYFELFQPKEFGNERLLSFEN